MDTNIKPRGFEDFCSAISGGMSLQQQVAYINRTFGKDAIPSDHPDFWKLIGDQVQLVISEFEELRDDGFGEQNFKEVRDGVADIIVTVLGIPHLAGFDGEPIVALADERASSAPRIPREEWLQTAPALELIEQALGFLNAAVSHQDIKALQDGVLFVLTTNLVLPFTLRFDYFNDMVAVTSSNLSKVSLTLEDAELTQRHYFEQVGIVTRVEDCPTFEGHIVKVSGTQIGKDGKKYPDNKFLKCRVGFKEPVFKD